MNIVFVECLVYKSFCGHVFSLSLEGISRSGIAGSLASCSHPFLIESCNSIKGGPYKATFLLLQTKISRPREYVEKRPIQSHIEDFFSKFGLEGTPG